jgi:hypothetical protein
MFQRYISPPYSEDRGNKSLRNIGDHLQDYMVSQSRIAESITYSIVQNIPSIIDKYLGKQEIPPSLLELKEFLQ